MSKIVKSKPKHSSQGPLTLWHGSRIRDLVKLFSRRPQLRMSRAGRIMALLPMGFYNSTMATIESALYRRLILKTEPVKPPIFILGHWRSGTTLIHNLMSSDPQFTSPTLYQTLFPRHFLTTERVVKKLTAAFVPKSRPMDNMPVHWDIPQEDEFALCLLTQISPYTWAAFPENLEIFRNMLEIESLPEEQQQEWKNALLYLLKKITIRQPKQIILKSPTHTFRIQTLLKMFPTSKFLYIYRNPFDVFNSTCHLRRILIEENTFGPATYKDVEEETIAIYNRAFERYQADKSLIPEGHLHEVKYENLSARPLEEMEKIYQALDLENVEGMRKAVEPQIEKLKSYKKNKFDPDPYWADRVYNDCRQAYKQFGYPPPLQELPDAQRA